MERFLDLDLDMVATKLEANVVAQLVLIKSVLPGMLERGEGTIIDITSAVATSDPPAPTGEGGWGLGYAVTKGAFHRVAGILAVELGPRGIFVVNVEPGYVLTERMAAGPGAARAGRPVPGAPPSVPGAVVAWLAGGPAGVTPEERTALNGTTISAQRFARETRPAPGLAKQPLTATGARSGEHYATVIRAAVRRRALHTWQMCVNRRRLRSRNDGERCLCGKVPCHLDTSPCSSSPCWHTCMRRRPYARHHVRLICHRGVAERHVDTASGSSLLRIVTEHSAREGESQHALSYESQRRTTCRCRTFVAPSLRKERAKCGSSLSELWLCPFSVLRWR